MRYEILILKGRKIIERHQYNNYAEAMLDLEMFEETMSYTHSVEFKDHTPFAR